MKYYERLVDLGCFSRNGVVTLTGNTETAHSLLSAYKKKGLIQSVRRDLFVAMSLETKQPVPNRYAIASHVAEGAYITHHSAFEYYGLANQVFYEVYVASKALFRAFDYDGVTYRYAASRLDAGIETKKDGVRITDMERTVIDSINDFEKIAGLEELLRCVDIIPYLDSEKLLVYLNLYNIGFLYQKAGYILEHFKKSLNLPDSFFAACQSKISKSKRYFYQGIQHERNALNKKWRLFAPNDLMAVIRKGGELH